MGCPKAGIRLPSEVGRGSSKRGYGYMPYPGAAFDTALELGRMKPLGKQTENLPTLVVESVNRLFNQHIQDGLVPIPKEVP
jgi:hypothetical protein